MTNLPWSCVPCAPAALTSLPTGTGPSTVCAPNYSSISPPWKELSTTPTAKAHSSCSPATRPPEALRRIGRTRLEKWLRGSNAYNSVAIADRAIAAANAQHVVVTGQRLGSTIVARIAQQILDIDAELSDLDDMIEERFTQHQQAAVIRSMPGFGPLLGAELVAATNGGLDSFHSADRLAAVAGLAPVPRDSGRISGNLKRPRRYDRRLLRVFYLAANNSIKTCPQSRAYYDRKRAEGKHHRQAILSLARRRVNVLGHATRQHRISAHRENCGLTISLRITVTMGFASGEPHTAHHCFTDAASLKETDR